MWIRRHVTLVYPIYPPLFAFHAQHSLEASGLQTSLVWTWRWGEYCFVYFGKPFMNVRVRDRVRTSHDACTSGTSRVLTVASLQLLKLEALIPAPADCEIRCVIKFLNTQSISPIEIHRQLCQVYGHTWLDGQYISCRSSAGRCLIIIHSVARNSQPVISIFCYTSRNSCPISVSVFRMTERRRWVVPIPGGRLLRQGIQKLVPWYENIMSHFRRWICWKIVQYLLFCSNKSLHWMKYPQSRWCPIIVHLLQLEYSD